MKALRDALDKVHPWFAKGGPLEAAYPMYEALDTFLYTPGEVATGEHAHSRRHRPEADDDHRGPGAGAGDHFRDVERRISGQHGDRRDGGGG